MNLLEREEASVEREEELGSEIYYWPDLGMTINSFFAQQCLMAELRAEESQGDDAAAKVI